MLHSLNKETSVSKSKETAHFETAFFNKNGAYILMLVFFASAAVIYHFIMQTLIPLLEASQLLIGFGIFGFSIAYLLRNKVKISVLDGLYYNVFGGAPIAMACFLFVNASCSNTYTETYAIANYELYLDRYTFKLEKNKYEEFWRIRTINMETRPAQTAHIQFTFCNGIFGYKVLKSTKLR